MCSSRLAVCDTPTRVTSPTCHSAKDRPRTGSAETKCRGRGGVREPLAVSRSRSSARSTDNRPRSGGIVIAGRVRQNRRGGQQQKRSDRQAYRVTRSSVTPAAEPHLPPGRDHQRFQSQTPITSRPSTVTVTRPESYTTAMPTCRLRQVHLRIATDQPQSTARPAPRTAPRRPIVSSGLAIVIRPCRKVPREKRPPRADSSTGRHRSIGLKPSRQPHVVCRAVLQHLIVRTLHSESRADHHSARNHQTGPPSRQPRAAHRCSATYEWPPTRPSLPTPSREENPLHNRCVVNPVAARKQQRAAGEH